MRVFQGVTGQAGQPSAIARGLRSLGAVADAGSIAQHQFEYSSDFDIALDRSNRLEHLFQTMETLSNQYDVFHFHCRSLSNNWPDQAYPALLDLLPLKERGKKLFFQYRGQEIRTAAEFSKSPYHYVNHRNSGSLFRRMPDHTKLAALNFIRSVADGIFVTDPELQTYVPEATIIPRVLHTEEWPFVGIEKSSCPLVVHAPSRRGVKGTEAILNAVRRLQRRLSFRFKLVEGLPHAQAKAAYEEADIVIDQLRIGWYGVLATETMALGKPTIAYIRSDLWEKHGAALPIINANPDTIEKVLESAILDNELRLRKAKESREYFLQTHSGEVVCARLLDVYSRTPHKPVDWAGVGRFMDRQHNIELRHARSLLPRKGLASAVRAWEIAREDGPMKVARVIASRVRNAFT